MPLRFSAEVKSWCAPHDYRKWKHFLENENIFLKARKNVGGKGEQKVVWLEVLCQPGILFSEVCSPVPVYNLFLFSYESVNAKDKSCLCGSQKRYLMPILHRYNMNSLFGVKVKLQNRPGNLQSKLEFSVQISHLCMDITRAINNFRMWLLVMKWCWDRRFVMKGLLSKRWNMSSLIIPRLFKIFWRVLVIISKPVFCIAKVWCRVEESRKLLQAT